VAITLSDTSTSIFCGAWLEDGTIVFPGMNGERLYRVSGDGGATERLTLDDPVQKLVFAVSPLPGSRGVLLVTVDTRNAQAIWALDLRDGTAHEVVAGATGAWYLPAAGGLLFARPDGSVFAAPFDLGTLTLSGPPVPVFAGVRTVQGLPELQVTVDGSLLYVAGTAAAADGSGTPVWVTRDGRVTPIDSTWRVGIVFNGGLALSPDGRRVALSSVDSAGRNDVFIRRLPSGVPSRLTFEGATNIRPAWSPDGEHVLYVSDRDGVPNLWVRRADGGRQAQPIGRTDRPVWEGVWSPDMTWLLLRTDDVAAGRGDILGVHLTGDTTPIPLVATEAEETSPAFSPDGRWLAYASAASGRKEVYVRPFPDVEDGMWQVSTNGGTEPTWAHSGREIFYRNVRGRLEVASVTTTPSFEVGAHRDLFDASAFWGNDDNRFFAVAPDDQRFLMLQPTPDAGPRGPGGWVLVETIIPEVKAALRR
jgi:WD40 repeat protein